MACALKLARNSCRPASVSSRGAPVTKPAPALTRKPRERVVRVRAEGPVNLNGPGQEYIFPTWTWGANTQIWVENLSSNSEARVTYVAGAAAGANIIVGPGQKTYAEGSFWGLPVRVINANGTPVKVWTI